ncbi:MAG: hypothetical protein KGI00_04380 [Candidatus Micrarchaeota archaeon]|nr:hypothetical protein [Candidatus Micrarchaeota archaeon]MDE1849936.1 hypothetical protein [Candidatus Micrarchaeota archaeon]
MAATFTVSRVEIKRMLSSLGIADKRIDEILSSMDKTHRHVNIVSLVRMLQNTGIRQRDIANILRRIGIGDISVAKVFDVIDETRISEAFGKVVEINVV